MKKNMFQRAALLALALILVVGLIPATSASAVAESEVVSCPHLTFTEDGAPDGYDGVTVGDVYEGYAYTLDMDFLLDGVDLDEFLKENDGETTFGLTFGSTSSNFSERISYRIIGDYWQEYPHKTWNDVVEYYQTFKTYNSAKIKNATDLRNWKIDVKFDLKGKNPGTYYLELLLRGKNWVEKKVKINLKKAPAEAEVKNIYIRDFDFPGVHASAMDKDAWCDEGKMVSIRYLEEDMQTERTKLMAGDTGWVEFTIETQGKTKFAYGATTDLIRSYNNNFHNISSGNAKKEQVSDHLCKFYHHYEIADDEKLVIKRGTINLTAPEAGAQADSKVELKNVDYFTIRNMKHDKFTAEEDAAIWLNLNNRGKWKVVTSFSALNIYQALVKLEPRGNYYFNAASEAAMKVPGAEKFTIKYRKAGDLNGNVKEDGWYLLAVFPVVQPKTFDLTIGYDQSEITANQNDRAFLTATSSCDLTKASDVTVQWYYSRDISKDKTGELCSSSDGDLKLQLDTFTVGTGYYKCVISCTLDGKTANVSYPGTEWVKLTVKEKTTSTSSLKLRPVGKQNIDITEAYQTIDFEVKPENASGEVRYQWYYCDASGKITDDTPIGDGQAVLIHGITGEPGQTFYYKCVARDSKNTESLVFSCTIRYGGSTTDTTTPGGETMPPDGETTPPDGEATPPDGETTAPDGEATAPDTPGMPGTDMPDPGASDGTKPDEDSAGSDITGTENPPASPEPGSHLWIMILIIVLAVGATAGAVFVVIKKKQ